MTVKAIVDGNTLGRQDPVGSSRPSAPASRPNVAVKPAPKAAAPAQELRPARPAKMTPWSPKAMSIDPQRTLSPQYSAARADAMASCSAPIRQLAGQPPVSSIAEANLLVEDVQLLDKSMELDAEFLRNHIVSLQRKMANGEVTPTAYQVAACIYGRRIAQLEGAPLIAGAVDGTLNPLSIGNPGSKWKQQGKDARIIASNGKSAMDCVKLEKLGGDSSVSGGGRVLVNRCTDEVEIGWCYSPGDCDTETGSGWTVQPGRSWPVKAQGTIRWAACHGRDSARFVEGSHGLRYYCRAPTQK